MSLILDALNRSRQDAQRMPGLDSRHYGDDIASNGNRRQLLPWLALLVAVLIIAWLLLDRESATKAVATDSEQASLPGSPARERASLGEQTVPSTVPQETAAPPPPVPDPAALPAASKPSPAPSAAALPQPAVEPTGDASSIADLYRQQQTTGKAAAAATTPAAKTPAAKTPTQSTPGPAAAASPAAAAESTVREEEVLDIEQLMARAEDELKDARLAEHEVPFLATLSQQTKNGIPTILYQRHDYSGVAARSSVVLNGKSLRTGGSNAGVKVEEILPDSVVLSYKGTRFRLRALNSWVNL